MKAMDTVAGPSKVPAIHEITFEKQTHEQGSKTALGGGKNLHSYSSRVSSFAQRNNRHSSTAFMTNTIQGSGKRLEINSDHFFEPILKKSSLHNLAMMPRTATA